MPADRPGPSLPALLLLLAPLGAAAAPSPYARARLDAVEAYLAAASSELERARERLELLQELGLAPGRFDGPVELALLRLELAGVRLEEAAASLRWQLERDDAPAPEGWRPASERFRAALDLLARQEPELAGAYEDTRLVTAPTGGLKLAVHRPEAREVRLRGYLAANAVSSEYLAALLAHEGFHAVQAARNRAAGRALLAPDEEEAEAWRRAASVWKAAGGRPELDLHGDMAATASAAEAGGAALAKAVAGRRGQEPHWLWAEPDPGEPVTAEPAAETELERRARLAGLADPKALAEAVRRLRVQVAEIRRSHSALAAMGLDRARETLEELPGLVAAHPLVVTASTMEANALSGKDYPLAMRLAFQAAHPVLGELDEAREALSRERLSEEERAFLREHNDRRSAEPKRPFKAAEYERRLGSRSKGLKGLTVAFAAHPDPAFEKAHPKWLLVPGLLAWREPEPGLAAAWLAWELVRREQGLGPDAPGTPEQAFEGAKAALEVWSRLDPEPEGFGREGLHRFVPLLAAREEGGEPFLRLYLDSER